MCRPITYLEDVSTSGLPHAEPHHVHHTSSSCDDLGPHVRELSDEPRAGRTDLCDSMGHSTIGLLPLDLWA